MDDLLGGILKEVNSRFLNFKLKKFLAKNMNSFFGIFWKSPNLESNRRVEQKRKKKERKKKRK